jgi:hypothetical protein
VRPRHRLVLKQPLLPVRQGCALLTLQQKTLTKQR